MSNKDPKWLEAFERAWLYEFDPDPGSNRWHARLIQLWHDSMDPRHQGKWLDWSGGWNADSLDQYWLKVYKRIHQKRNIRFHNRLGRILGQNEQRDYRVRRVMMLFVRDCLQLGKTDITKKDVRMHVEGWYRDNNYALGEQNWPRNFRATGLKDLPKSAPSPKRGSQ